MAGEPQITVVGNLTADPELRFTQQGKAVAKCNLAVTPRRKNRETGQWDDQDTMWFAVTVWDQYAEHVADSLSKGDRVHVTGRLSCRKWTTEDGRSGVSWEISADEITPSLRFATAKVNKAERGGGGAMADDPWTTATPTRNTLPQGASVGAHEPSWQNEPPF